MEEHTVDIKQAVKPRLHKPLKPVKVIGYILMFLSIFSFGGNVMAAVMWLVFPFRSIPIEQQKDVIGTPMVWMFTHYWQLALGFSIIWIPLFFGSRGLIHLKRWAIWLTSFVLIVLVIIMLAMGAAFIMIPFAPGFFKVAYFFISTFYAAVLIAGIYFISRRKAREALDAYNRGEYPPEPLPKPAVIRLPNLMLDPVDTTLKESTPEETPQHVVDRLRKHPSATAIHFDLLTGLSLAKLHHFEQFLDKIQPGQRICFHANRVKLVDEERWNALVQDGNATLFQVLYG